MKENQSFDFEKVKFQILHKVWLSEVCKIERIYFKLSSKVLKRIKILSRKPQKNSKIVMQKFVNISLIIVYLLYNIKKYYIVF